LGEPSSADASRAKAAMQGRAKDTTAMRNVLERIAEIQRS